MKSGWDILAEGVIIVLLPNSYNPVGAYIKEYRIYVVFGPK